MERMRIEMRWTGVSEFLRQKTEGGRERWEEERRRRREEEVEVRSWSCGGLPNGEIHCPHLLSSIHSSIHNYIHTFLYSHHMNQLKLSLSRPSYANCNSTISCTTLPIAPPLHPSIRSRSQESYSCCAIAARTDASLLLALGIWHWIQLIVAARVISVVLPPTCEARYRRCWIFLFAVPTDVEPYRARTRSKTLARR